MLTEISERQFREWMVYYSMEPFGEERADIRQAITSCLIANANKGKNQKALKLADFMLFKEKEPQREQSDEEIIKIFVRAAGGKVIWKKPKKTTKEQKS